MKNLEDNEILESFLKGYFEVIKLLEAGDESGAKLLFNSKIYPDFIELVNNSDSIIREFLTYFIEMDEYFNNSAIKTIGMVTKELLIGSYHSDFQEVILEVRGKAGY